MEALLNLEEAFQEQGRIEGQKAGLTAGYIEGRILGCERAFEVNREVGFYAGIAKEILKEFGENSSISGGRRQEGGGQEEAGDGIKDVHQSESSTDDNDEELAGKTSKNTHKTLSKRALNSVKTLASLCSTFPLDNSSKDIELLDLLAKIQTKYRLCRALISPIVSLPYYSNVSSSFLAKSGSIESLETSGAVAVNHTTLSSASIDRIDENQVLKRTLDKLSF